MTVTERVVYYIGKSNYAKVTMRVIYFLNIVLTLQLLLYQHYGKV